MPPGEPGPTGPPGPGVPEGGTEGQYLRKNSDVDYDSVWATVAPGGGGGDLTYVHHQSLAASTWGPINHGLGKFPSVTVVDSADSVVIGDVEFVDANHVTLRFTAAFSGEAYFN